MSWDSISQVLRCSKGFLLYDTPELFHWLPYHAFHSQDDIEAFVRLSKRKAKQYREATLSPLPNIIIGFLIAPVISPIVNALGVLWLAGIHYPGIVSLLFIEIINEIPVAYTISLLGGIPVLLLLRRLQSDGIGLFLIAGAVLGAIPPVVRWAQYIGIRTLGDFSFWSRPQMLLWVSQQLLSGIAAAALFWMIAVRLNPGWSRSQRNTAVEQAVQ